MLDLNSRVGAQPESTSARGVATGMVDDLRVGFESILADVALLKQVFVS